MRYVPQMQSIAERVNNPARIVQCIQMHNESEFAGLVLGSLYSEVDQIIVIEGAVANRPNQTEDGHSTDDTVDIINDFIEHHDPDNKVVHISLTRPWSNLEEMKQAFLDTCYPGDWILINDADEFFQPQDIRRLRKAIDLYPHMCEFVPLFLHFYRDFGHIAVPGPEWQPQHQRFFKLDEGMKYNSHPIATDVAGRCTYFSPEYQPRRALLNNFFCWHYGYARVNMDQVMRQKLDYYESELAKHGGANVKFREKCDLWFSGKEPTLLFDGEHPEAVHAHPMFSVDMPTPRSPSQTMDDPDIYPFGGTMDESEIPNWRDVAPYKQALACEPYGNIWLCMTGQAQPAMPMYHNEVTINVE